jgi:NAD(P)-dependent dehydrogenase (short-subunit alcohol dehydrogenase family)
VSLAVLDGRVAIVTGGGSGVGHGIALGLSDHGAAVAVVGAGAGAVAAEIVAGGRRAAAACCAFNDGAETTRAFAQMAGALGPIDLVVHAASLPAALVQSPLIDLDEDSWDACGEGVLRSGLWVAQAARIQLTGRGGAIVFVIPTIAMTGAAGLVPYATAMEGQRALVRSAARQWGAQGIRVNCVAPPLETMSDHGPAADEAPPLNTSALGRPPDGRSDIAPVIAMLAGDTGHFVTGTTIPVDGGVWMAP